MIEVGPGPGGITRKLFEHGAGRVAAIEKDIRLFPALQVLLILKYVSCGRRFHLYF